MEYAQQKEFKHLGMDLEFLLRKMPGWRITLKAILFHDGVIAKLGEKVKKELNNFGLSWFKVEPPLRNRDLYSILHFF